MNMFATVGLDLGYPTIYMCITAAIVDAIGKYDAVAALVKIFSYRSKTLLAGCIPNIEHCPKTFGFNLLYLKINTDCTEVLFLKVILYVSHNERSFSDSTVSNYEIFEATLLFLFCLH